MDEEGKKERGIAGRKGWDLGSMRGACSSHSPLFACYRQQLVGGLRDTSYQFFMPIL